MSPDELMGNFEGMTNALHVLEESVCWQLVRSAEIGRIGFVHDERPLVLPVTYRVDDDAVVFRTAEGSKLEAAVLRRPVVFEVDDWNPDDRSGWSVLVHGVATLVTSPARLDHLNTLGLSPYVDDVERDRWIRVRTQEITGRATSIEL